MNRYEKVTRWGVLLEYLKRESKVFLCLVKYLFCGVLLILGCYWTDKIFDIPQFTIKNLSETLEKVIADAINSQISTDDGIQPVLLAFFLISVFSFAMNWIKKLIGSGGCRYDSIFLSRQEQKVEDFKYNILGFVLFFIVYFIVIFTNLFNAADDALSKNKLIVKVIFIAVAIVITIGSLFWNFLRKRENGRSDTLSCLYAAYGVSLLVTYPIENNTLIMSLVYTMAVVLLSMCFINELEYIGRNKVSAFYFVFSSLGEKMFIHYRLDDERVVCSTDNVLARDSKRILYPISELCKADIIDAGYSYDENWLYAIKELEKAKNNIRLGKCIKKAGKAIRRRYKKADHKKIRIVAEVIRKSNVRSYKNWKEKRAWKSKYEDARKEVLRLKKLKKTLKCYLHLTVAIYDT